MKKLILTMITLFSINVFAGPVTQVTDGTFDVRAWNCSEFEKSPDIINKQLYLGQIFFYAKEDTKRVNPAFLPTTQIDNDGNVYVAETPIAKFDPQDLRAQLKKSCSKLRAMNSSEYLRYPFTILPGTELSFQTGETSTACRWDGRIGSFDGKKETTYTTLLMPKGKKIAVGQYSSTETCANLSTFSAGLGTTVFVQLPLLLLKSAHDHFQE